MGAPQHVYVSSAKAGTTGSGCARAVFPCHRRARAHRAALFCEPALDARAPPNPSSALEVCRDWLARGECRRGNACPYRHNNSDKVCKHWLRDLCKKGDQCEFLHEYNLKKMPECHFFALNGALWPGRARRGATFRLTSRRRVACKGAQGTRTGTCNNGDECKYLHIDPASKVKVCAWYARGFCKNGTQTRGHARPTSTPSHVRRPPPRPPAPAGAAHARAWCLPLQGLRAERCMCAKWPARCTWQASARTARTASSHSTRAHAGVRSGGRASLTRTLLARPLAWLAGVRPAPSTTRTLHLRRTMARCVAQQGRGV